MKRVRLAFLVSGLFLAAGFTELFLGFHSAAANAGTMKVLGLGMLTVGVTWLGVAVRRRKKALDE